MNESTHRVHGIAAPLPIANLDTDQIMPKQFLHGIDKKGLARGLLWDLRFSGDGALRPEFILNRPEFSGTRVLLAGPNFGCGSSREHAVWGLQQFGIEAVIASAYGEIFYSNAMNNRLLVVMIPQDKVDALIEEANASTTPLELVIDVETMTVRSSAADDRLFDERTPSRDVPERDRHDRRLARIQGRHHGLRRAPLGRATLGQGCCGAHEGSA